jgi:hypothetical protein
MKDVSFIRDMLLIILAAIGIVHLMQIAAAIACMTETQEALVSYLSQYEIEITVDN